jgi:hypothetical protein
MADRLHWLNELRAAVTKASDDWADVLELAAFPTVMGWVQSDFDDVCMNSDISSADLFTALSSINTVNSSFTAEQATIAKLLP